MPGEYVVNVHAYNKRGGLPVPVLVTVDKINPFRTIVSKTVMLSERGDEKTVCRFTLSSGGNVLSTNELPKSFTQIGW